MFGGSSSRVYYGLFGLKESTDDLMRLFLVESSDSDATALRLNRLLNSVTQGSRSGNPWAVRPNRFAVRQFKSEILTRDYTRVSLHPRL